VTAPKISEIEKALVALVGSEVARPPGPLSGHNSGLPFEQLIHGHLERAFPGRAYRHFELLNRVLEANPKASGASERISLLGPPSIQHLLARGDRPMSQWSSKSKFDEKQNDTAETVILADANLQTLALPITLIDVKTQDAGKCAQPPNIISAEKVADACLRAISESPSCSPRLAFDIVYVSVKWTASKTHLRCESLRVISLVKIPPTDCYINWVAAQQIQFQPDTISQSFAGSGIEWARAYLKHFVASLEARINKQRDRLTRYKAAISIPEAPE
jgi:hypothetical protein